MTNRQIKFRAWDKHQKGFIAEEIFFSGSKAYILRGRMLMECDAYVSQFTGLLDKNGKEIWEGDICKNERGEVGVVEFVNGGFASKYVPPYDWDPMEQWDGLLSKNEVIGNIYENPELLEGGAGK